MNERQRGDFLDSSGLLKMSSSRWNLAQKVPTLRSLINVQCTLINFLKKPSLYALIKDL